MAAIPFFFPLWCNELINVVNILAPEHPRGWPRETAPPDVFTLSELIDDDFRDELIDKRSLSELKNKFEELNSMNWNYMTKAQKDLREKLANMIEFYNS